MTTGNQGPWHTEGERVKVVTTYLVTGSTAMTSQCTGVPSSTIRRWKTELWWKELVEQIQSEENQEIDAKLAKRISKALDIVEDRLENGDFFLNPRTQKFERKPVSLKDTWKPAKEMIDVRQLLRKQQPEQVNQQAIADILKGLASEFAMMAKRKLREKFDNGEITIETVPTPETQEVLALPEKV